MKDAVFLVDVEQTDDCDTFIFRRNNAAHRQRTGLSEDELRGQTPQELLGDEQGRAVAANYRRCVEQRDTIEYEEAIEFSTGTSHWQTKLTPIIEDGQVTKIVGVARDITEKKEQEQKLQRMHRRFETVLDTMSAAVFLKDPDGRYLLINQACRDLFGIDDREAIGLTDDDLFPPEVAEQARADDRQVIETGEMIEIEETVPTARGSSARLTRKSPVYDDDGEITALCGVSTDITAQKRQQELSQQQSSLLEAVMETNESGVLVTDLDWNVLHYNEQFVDIWDLASENGLPSDGQVLLEAAVDRVTDPGEFTELVEQLYESPDDVHSDEVQLRDGRTLDLYSAPVVDEERRYGRIWVYRDVTDLKAYEQTLEEQRDNLDVLNQVVRHDIRNKIQLVLAHAEMAQADGEDTDGEHIEQVLDAARDAVEITTTARDVTEVMLQADGEHHPVLLRSVLEGEIEAARSNSEQALVRVDGSVPNARVLADDMLPSVFRNVLHNAIQHNDTQIPEVTVSATSDEGRVLVRIADNGPGVPDEQKTAVFEQGEMGFDSDGTGLGLYLVDTLVGRYDGDVRVEDNDPTGAIFIIELPVAEET